MFVYQNVHGGDHYDSTGGIKNFGDIQSHDVVGEFRYGITDRLAVTAGMPFVVSKFTVDHSRDTSVAHEEESTIDDGRYRGTFQDFHAAVRYSLVQNPVMLTPFFELGTPTHGYETFGHSAAGRNLQEYRVGTNVGRRLNPILSRAYFDLKMGYTFVESLEDLNLDYVNVDLEVGVALHRRLWLRGFGAIRKTQGGLEAPVPATSPFFEIHDQAIRSHYSQAGGGINFGLTRDVEVFGEFLGILSAKNSHAFSTLAIGVVWKFKTRRSENILSITAPKP